jgi:A/G-specific adenine glycosylase
MVPYFHRFLARFPSLQSLAEAPQDDVLALWSGLGYYARARNLHRAAQEALARHGALPKTLGELRALPGFGPYTSAAVASLAFGVDAALVDGNVARVLARVLGLEGDVDRAKLRSWELAPGLLPQGSAGEFNEALMELGALICTPRSPSCSRCPIAEGCVARERGDPEEVPAARPKKARPLVIRAALRLQREDGQVLLQRQPEGALFEGLWDLPALVADEEDLAAVGMIAARLGRELGARGDPVHLARVEQTLTHREMRVEIFALAAPKKDPAKGRPELRWAAQDVDALASIGLSSLARKSLIASSRAGTIG